MHCSKCVSFWTGTSYSRPPTHTSLPPWYSLPRWRRHYVSGACVHSRSGGEEAGDAGWCGRGCRWQHSADARRRCCDVIAPYFSAVQRPVRWVSRFCWTNRADLAKLGFRAPSREAMKCPDPDFLGCTKPERKTLCNEVSNAVFAVGGEA